MIKKELCREREIRAWKLRCDGWEQAEIAEELGVTQPAISRILSRVDARAKSQLTGDVNALRQEQAAAYDRIECEAMEAFEKSKGSPKHVSGDARFLGAAIAARQARGRLFGLDAPKEYRLEQPAQKPEVDLEVQRQMFNDPELRRLSLERACREHQLAQERERSSRMGAAGVWAKVAGGSN